MHVRGGKQASAWNHPLHHKSSGGSVISAARLLIATRMVQIDFHRSKYPYVTLNELVWITFESVGMWLALVPDARRGRREVGVGAMEMHAVDRGEVEAVEPVEPVESVMMPVVELVDAMETVGFCKDVRTY